MTFTITISWMIIPIIITALSYLWGFVWIKGRSKRKIETPPSYYCFVLLGSTIIPLLSWVVYLLMITFLQ